MKDERAVAKFKAPPPSIPSPPIAQQEAKVTIKSPPYQSGTYGPLPSKQERFIRDLEEENLRRLRGEQKPITPEPQRTVVAQGSGGAEQKENEAQAPKTKFEELSKELRNLEDQYRRKNDLISRKTNALGQKCLTKKGSHGARSAPMC